MARPIFGWMVFSLLVLLLADAAPPPIEPNSCVPFSMLHLFNFTAAAPAYRVLKNVGALQANCTGRCEYAPTEIYCKRRGVMDIFECNGRDMPQGLKLSYNTFDVEGCNCTDNQGNILENVCIYAGSVQIIYEVVDDYAGYVNAAAAWAMYAIGLLVFTFLGGMWLFQVPLFAKAAPAPPKKQQ